MRPKVLVKATLLEDGEVAIDGEQTPRPGHWAYSWILRPYPTRILRWPEPAPDEWVDPPPVNAFVGLEAFFSGDARLYGFSHIGILSAIQFAYDAGYVADGKGAWVRDTTPEAHPSQSPGSADMGGSGRPSPA